MRPDMQRQANGGDLRARPRETHYQQALEGLQKLLERLALSGETRLPPEDQLADRLGFSRPTIRSALLALQTQGKVHRVHGLGTFINRHTLQMGANLAEDRPFLDVIAGLGREATVEILRIAIEPLEPSVAARLAAGSEAATGEPVRAGHNGRTGSAQRSAVRTGVVIERLFRASGVPAVFSRDLLPTDHMTVASSSIDVERLDAGRSTFAFLAASAGVEVRYSVARIRAVGATEHIASALRVTTGTPVLLLDHLHIDGEDRPVAVTEAYIDQDVVPFSQVRTAGEL